MKCTSRSPAVLAQQLAHLNSRYALHRVFWKCWLIGKAMLPLDHKAGFMVFLKTIKLAQLTHMNSYLVLQCPVALAQAKLHHCIRILKGLKPPFGWKAYLNN